MPGMGEPKGEADGSAPLPPSDTTCLILENNCDG
jgi:hypothetical protein